MREDVIRASDSSSGSRQGIHGSGLWLEKQLENRFQAAEIVGKYYYNQKPELLKFVLSKPIDRVRYDQLTPVRDELNGIVQLGVESGMFKEFIPFESYVDASFTVDPVLEALAMPPDDGALTNVTEK